MLLYLTLRQLLDAWPLGFLLIPLQGYVEDVSSSSAVCIFPHTDFLFILEPERMDFQLSDHSSQLDLHLALRYDTGSDHLVSGFGTFFSWKNLTWRDLSPFTASYSCAVSGQEDSLLFNPPSSARSSVATALMQVSAGWRLVEALDTWLVRSVQGRFLMRLAALTKAQNLTDLLWYVKYPDYILFGIRAVLTSSSLVKKVPRRRVYRSRYFLSRISATQYR